MSRYDDRPRFDDLEEKPTKKRKKFNIFDLMYSKERQEDDPGDRDAERNFKFFFKLAGRNTRRFFNLNLLLVLCNFPIFFLMLAFSQNLHKTALAPANALGAPIYGASLFGAASPVSSAMYGLYGVNTPFSYWTPAAITVLIIGIVLLLVTFGLSMIAITYVLRNIVRGEMIFLWQDWWYSIKRNIRQGLILGILDLLFIALLLYDIYFFYLNLAYLWAVVGFWASVVIFLFYFSMRFYTYLQALTFDLSIYKIFKNAFIFSILGLKRNFLASLGIVIAVVLNYAVMLILLPVGILLPFMYTVSLCAFMGTYAAWPVIKKYMIDRYEQAPANDDADEEDDYEDDEEPVEAE